MRIGVDLDGVVYDWESTARYLIEAHHGIKVEQSRYHDHIQDQVPDEIWQWLWTDGVDLGLFKYGKYIRGSIDGLRELAKCGTLEVVTIRPRKVIQDTLRFISGLPDVFNGVHILGDNGLKSSVGCDIYVDDNASVIQEVRTAGREGIVFNQPWNQDVLGPRAYDWPGVMQHV